MSRVTALADRYTRLLALRLIAGVDELLERFPELRDDPVFQPAWISFAALRGPSLGRALRRPALAQWISWLLDALASPALETCPEHHVPRLAARLSSLAVDLAGQSEVAARTGAARVMGCRSFPILCGEAQVRPPSPRPTLVCWDLNEQFRLRDQQGGLLLSIDPVIRSTETTAEGWEVEWARSEAAVPFFTRTPCVKHPTPVDPTTFGPDLRHALDDLPVSTRELMSKAVDAAGPACKDHPLEALRWLALPEQPRPPDVTLALAESLIGQCTALFRFDTSSDLTVALGTSRDAELGTALSDELLSGDAARRGSLFDQILTTCEGRQPAKSADPADALPAPHLDFAPVVRRCGDEAGGPGRWVQPKNHDLAKAPDWSMLDNLLALSPATSGALRAALEAAVDPEVRHFGLACLDYHDGHFSDALEHLLAGLRLDEDCEEYWLLLAFSLRHLRHYDLFDEIVFSARRSDELLTRIQDVS